MKLCTENCEFKKWKEGKFICDLHEKDLMYVKIDEGIRFLRCKECEQEQKEYEKIGKR